MMCLPDELLLHIFSLLSHKDLTRCVQVCQHFKRVASDLSLCKLSANIICDSAYIMILQRV